MQKYQSTQLTKTNRRIHQNVHTERKERPTYYPPLEQKCCSVITTLYWLCSLSLFISCPSGKKVVSAVWETNINIFRQNKGRNILNSGKVNHVTNATYYIHLSQPCSSAIRTVSQKRMIIMAPSAGIVKGNDGSATCVPISGDTPAISPFLSACWYMMMIEMDKIFCKSYPNPSTTNATVLLLMQNI